MKDKYTATWTSHTSISDFLRCPRLYFLKHVYKDPSTGHKIKLMAPALALGQAVHEVLESLSNLPKDERFDEPLPNKFQKAWEKVEGKKGGFLTDELERHYKKRGSEMIARAYNHPGPLRELSVKIKKDLPYFWLSEEDNIILCGKIDWLEYLPDTDSVHIIDFKTGKRKEDPDSLQLPIYHLLVHECQNRKVTKASYWYLEDSDELEEKKLPDLLEARQKLLTIGMKMKTARQLKKFDCPNGNMGCYACGQYEAILNNEAEKVGVDEYNYDVYILTNASKEEDEMESELL